MPFRYDYDCFVVYIYVNRVNYNQQTVESKSGKTAENIAIRMLMLTIVIVIITIIHGIISIINITTKYSNFQNFIKSNCLKTYNGKNGKNNNNKAAAECREIISQNYDSSSSSLNISHTAVYNYNTYTIRNINENSIFPRFDLDEKYIKPLHTLPNIDSLSESFRNVNIDPLSESFRNVNFDPLSEPFRNVNIDPISDFTTVNNINNNKDKLINESLRNISDILSETNADIAETEEVKSETGAETFNVIHGTDTNLQNNSITSSQSTLYEIDGEEKYHILNSLTNNININNVITQPP